MYKNVHVDDAKATSATSAATMWGYFHIIYMYKLPDGGRYRTIPVSRPILLYRSVLCVKVSSVAVRCVNEATAALRFTLSYSLSLSFCLCVWRDGVWEPLVVSHRCCCRRVKHSTRYTQTLAYTDTALSLNHLKIFLFSFSIGYLTHPTRYRSMPLHINPHFP